jgi:hypothetical protein
MEDGFRMAMYACAGLAAAGGLIAWLTISSEVLEPEAGEPVAEPAQPEYSCGVAGTPLRPSPEPAAPS